jgi:hypothetical protein
MSKEAIFQLNAFFHLLADEQWEAVRDVMGQQFTAFENGDFYTSDEFLNMIENVFSTGARYQWHLTNFRILQRSDDVLIAYHNVGKVQLQGELPVAKHWREMALLTHNGDHWQIDCLWSVRVENVRGLSAA